MNCPQCAQTLPEDSIVAGVAQCPACGGVFDVQVPDALPQGQEQLPSPPSGVLVQVHPNGVELALPWRRDLNVAGHLTSAALGLGPIVAWAAGGHIAFLVFGGLLTYNWVCFLVNATTVLIGAKGVEFSHGPLPSLNRRVVLPAKSLRRRLLIGEHVRKVRNGKVTTYQLQGQGLDIITKFWNHRETLVYVRDVIERIHGQHGELPMH